MTRHQLKPQPTAQERIAAKRKLQDTPKKDYYLAQKYAGLSYDYGQIAEADREMVQRAALDIRGRLKRTVEDMIEIGRQLIAVKAILEHGEFLAWIRVEFDQNIRDLQKSMQVAQMIPSSPNAGNYPLLSASALYLLAAPSTPETVRWGIQERIELTDWRPTRREIRSLIDEERPPKPKQIPGPVAEPEPAHDVIEAEYTVLASATVHPAISRALAMKLQDAVLHRIMRSLLTPAEQDELLVALSKALKGEQ